MKTPLFIIMIALLASCGGSSSNPDQKTISNEYGIGPGENCTFGGSQIDAGIDSNNNGLLDIQEVLSSTYICLDPAPSTPHLQLTFDRPKTFTFSWSSSDNATHYSLLENNDGVSTYQEVATVDAATTNYEHTVFLPERYDAKYILKACNNTTCALSNEINFYSNLADSIGYLKAFNLHQNAIFGNAVAISNDGNMLAIGSSGESSLATGIHSPYGGEISNEARGAVYIYNQANSQWQQQALIKPSSGSTNSQMYNDYFGYSVAISTDGSTLAVGAPGDNSGSKEFYDTPSPQSGAVHIYARSENTWKLQSFIKSPKPRDNDNFGMSIALSDDGNLIAIGVPNENSSSVGVNGSYENESAPNSGAVYLFSRTDDEWHVQDYIKASNTDHGNNFGASVSLSSNGSILAVGAKLEGNSITSNGTEIDNLAPESGAVYIFTHNHNSWYQSAYIKASNGGPGNLFGSKVELDNNGDTLAVSAPAINTYAGAVYVYEWRHDQWLELAYLSPESDYNEFGFSLSLSADGNLLAVGAPGEDGPSIGLNQQYRDFLSIHREYRYNSGSAYLFSYEDSSWKQISYIKSANTREDHLFGSSISLSENILAVGAVGENNSLNHIHNDDDLYTNTNSGAIYLY